MMLKKIAIALATLAMPLSSTAATTAATTTTAGAIRIELRFYSDDSMTHEIGGSIVYCDNTTLVWGEQFTSFYYTQIVNDCEE